MRVSGTGDRSGARDRQDRRGSGLRGPETVQPRCPGAGPAPVQRARGWELGSGVRGAVRSGSCRPPAPPVRMLPPPRPALPGRSPLPVSSPHPRTVPATSAQPLRELRTRRGRGPSEGLGLSGTEAVS